MKHVNARIRTAYPVDVPFETDEGNRFRDFLGLRGAKAGPFVRQLLLTAMDPSAGPIVEAAMRGRAVPDLGAGQARELAETFLRTGVMTVPLGVPASVTIATDALPQQSVEEFAASIGNELGLRR
jgi:hypothetical protein